MQKLLFATSNPSKVNRFLKGLNENDIEVVTLKDINIDVDIDENGIDAVENALIKARVYSKLIDLPVLAMDDCLYLDGVSDIDQPGTHVRRVNGKRLTDEEVIEHYTGLVKKYGENGRLTSRWVYGIAIVSNNEEKTYTWSKEDFYIVDKPTDKIHIGYPLDSISINKKLNKYFTDMTDDDKKSIAEDESDVIDFIVNNI